MGASYEDTIDYERGVILFVDFQNEGVEVTDYSLVLLADVDDRTETIRVYDSAHGFNEMHRYARGGSKQDGVVFSNGTLGEGMRMAMLDIKERYLAMIEDGKDDCDERSAVARELEDGRSNRAGARRKADRPGTVVLHRC